MDREEEVILTLSYLVKSGADPDAMKYGPTPRQLAVTHAFMRVRDMFSINQGGIRIHRGGCSLSTHDLSVTERAHKDVRCSAARRGFWGSNRHVQRLEFHTLDN